MPATAGRHIAIVGAGLIGRSWGFAFARGGHAVRMFDPVAGAAQASHALLPHMAQELSEADLLDGQRPEDIVARITVSPSLQHCVAGASYVQESAPEKREVKAALFSEIEAHAAEDAVLASSTSIILPSLFTGHLARKAQCLVAHPLNPPHLIPAIEIVPAPWTDPAITAKAKALHESIGQKPIVMQKEIDGFLMNRLQGALLEECFRLLEDGYVSAEDIDISVKHGLAMRWAFIGPFETMDLNAPGGIRDYVERYNKGFEVIRDGAQWRADWTGKTLDTLTNERAALLPRTDILKRQDWRDSMLVKLAAFKRGIGLR